MNVISFLNYLVEKGNYAFGQEIIDELIIYARDKENPSLEASAYNVKGHICLILNKYEEAEKFFRSAIELGNDLIESRARANLAKVLNAFGNRKDALEMVNKALDILYKHQNFHIDAGLITEMGYYKITKGDILLDMGKTKEAQENYLHAHQIFSRSQDQKGKGLVDIAIAMLYLREHRFESAKDYTQKALNAFLSAGGYLVGEADALKIFSFIKYQEGAFDEALELMRSAKLKDEYIKRDIQICEFNQFYLLLGKKSHGKEPYKNLYRLNEACNLSHPGL